MLVKILIFAVFIAFNLGIIIGIKIGMKVRPKIKRINRKHCKIMEIKSCLGERDRVIKRLNKLN